MDRDRHDCVVVCCGGEMGPIAVFVQSQEGRGGEEAEQEWGSEEQGKGRQEE